MEEGSDKNQLEMMDDIKEATQQYEESQAHSEKSAKMKKIRMWTIVIVAIVIVGGVFIWITGR